MRGFIDDAAHDKAEAYLSMSQSAFMRGFIDDVYVEVEEARRAYESQSAFMRGFIDDGSGPGRGGRVRPVSIRVHARLHR